MAILHIEHPISDLDTWLEAFRTFAPARENAGVRHTQVWQPDADPHYVFVHLTFETPDAAANFRTFLRQVVWASPETSPALAGEPKAEILTEVVV
ncbi:MAG TPA: hypothetical protein VGO30_16655 [Mycobacterium sp.]|jgi:hypothetical protein|nr:hypothetical protein [Mycobacterium sp.]